MKKTFLILLAAVLSIPSFSAEKVRFMASWSPQAQFAGYCVAKDLGYYEEEGLDVEINHFDREVGMELLSDLKKGRVDIMSVQYLEMIAERAMGVQIVNVLQLSQNCSFVFVSRKSLADLARLEECKVTLLATSISRMVGAYDAKGGMNVHWYPSYDPINLFLSGAVDAVILHGFNEYIRLIYSMGRIPAENLRWLKDTDYNCPEDGLAVTKDYYESHKQTVDKFVRASIRGWQYVAQNRDKAIEIVMKYVGSHDGIGTKRFFQSKMLDIVLELQKNPESGKADFRKVPKEVFDATIDQLMQAGYCKERIDYEDFIR